LESEKTLTELPANLNVWLLIWPFLPITCYSSLFLVPDHWETGPFGILILILAPLWFLAGFVFGLYIYYNRKDFVNETCLTLSIYANFLWLVFVVLLWIGAFPGLNPVG
jgi:hypothetical protein